jgi:predicted esterase
VLVPLLLLLVVTPLFNRGVTVVTHAPDARAAFANDLPKGQIIDKVTCARDPAQSYSLYLPSNYDPARKWPVLYAFDPGARGRVPVERFREAAERFGWIIAGSNNSRNGSMQASIDAWNGMTRDTADRFSINGARVYATGFSGGARVATFFSIQCGDCLTGIIAVGAGFPEGTGPSARTRLAFFGAAGIEDFNFAELKLLDEQLSRVNTPHLIATFAGRHEWLPSSLAIEALAWMELMAIRSGVRERDETLIESLWNEKLKQASELENSGKPYEAYQVYLALSSSFKDLREVAVINRKLDQLRTNREVQDAARDEQQEIKKQREFEGQISSLVAATERVKVPDDGGSSLRNSQVSDEGIDPSMRLRAILNDLRRQSKAEQDSGTRRVARRVISGQYLALFERGSDSLQNKKRYNDAVWFFTVATQIDPDRAGGFYYLAWAYSAKGDKKQSLKALQAAVDKGFSDAAALAANKAFDSLRDDPQYQKIISAIKTK